MRAYRGSGITPTAGVLGSERVLQELHVVRGQDDATKTARTTPYTTALIVKNRI